MGRVKYTSDCDGGGAGPGMSATGGGSAAPPSSAAGAAAGGSVTGGTWASIYPIFETDFFFCLAISLSSRALHGSAVPLTLLHFLRRAGVSATRMTGTCTSGSKTYVTRDVCSQIVHLQHHLQIHANGNLPQSVSRLT